MHACQERGRGTLNWARKMKDFRAWRCSDTDARERILWIRGSLGIGKTIMAAHYIESLKSVYPEAVIAYFFCRRGQQGLNTASDIIRTLAYHCCLADTEVRSNLEILRRTGFGSGTLPGVRLLFERLIREPMRALRTGMFFVIDGVDEADWGISAG